MVHSGSKVEDAPPDFGSSLLWLCEENEGVPFLLLPRTAANSWSGSDAPMDGRVVQSAFHAKYGEPGTAASDYHRAADLADGLHPIEVGGRIGWVIGDCVPLVAWVRGEDAAGGRIVVPQEWGDLTDADAIASALEVLATRTGEMVGEIEVGSDGLVLFSAADRLVDPQFEKYGHGRIDIDVEAGKYQMNGAQWQSAGGVLYNVCALRRCAAN